MFKTILLCFCISILSLIIYSCSSPGKHDVVNDYADSYSDGFDIRQYSEFTRITVKNPWQKAKGESYSYYLSNSPESLHDTLNNQIKIKIPVERVVVFSTTHIGFIAALQKSSSIVGVSGKDFISDTVVISSLENKKCIDIGFAPNIDFESILQLKPDLVFLYGLDASVNNVVKRLKDAGIQSVLVSEFLEDHPLGKAEWIRFFSAFFETENISDSIFSDVRKNYLELRDSISETEKKPLILTGLPWKDTWYMSGGKSFTAKFIEDAGGEYLWKDNLNTDFIPLDLESVFQKSINADIWINIGSAGNRSDILAIDPRLSYVPAFKNGMLFNNNRRINSKGGNDFWESGAVRPDWVLKDLISIFHGDSSANSDLYYYRKLQ